MNHEPLPSADRAEVRIIAATPEAARHVAEVPAAASPRPGSAATSLAARAQPVCISPSARRTPRSLQGPGRQPASRPSRTTHIQMKCDRTVKAAETQSRIRARTASPHPENNSHGDTA